MSAWESTRTPSLRKSASCSIIALRNNSESPILSSSATVHSPSVDWSLLKEPHGGRLRQRPLPFTHSRGHYLNLLIHMWCLLPLVPAFESSRGAPLPKLQVRAPVLARIDQIVDEYASLGPDGRRPSGALV